MIFTADFETTTDENDCRVWAWGVCEVGNPSYFKYGNTIDSFFQFMESSKNSTFYFHNARFDASFILCHLFEHNFKWVLKSKYATSKTFTTLISDMGQFYSMNIYFDKNKKGKQTNAVTIYDSQKIIPFAAEQIAKDFNLPINKLKIDYDEYRAVGHELTPEEVKYLQHDVEIMARALHILFEQGLDKMTQASNAMHDYKKIIGDKCFKRWFPIPDYDKDIRQSYKGGYTYLRPNYKNVELKTGLVLDVNSLYPSVMRYCPLPYGDPIPFIGEYEKDDEYNLYIQMMTCQFELKEGFLPTIQIKKNLMFIPTQYLESSRNDDGILEEVTLCLTSVDLELFREHYHILNPVYHSGWKFKSSTKLFAPYIDKWVDVKIEATKTNNKAMRAISKLMLNALYGRFALNPNVQSKIPYYEDGAIKYQLGEKETRDPVYLPVGTFITAWARHKTITSAQKLYKYFVYADTDSLHLNIDLPQEILNMPSKKLEKLTTADLKKYGIDLPDDFVVDPYELGAWKVEESFKRARYIRQKSYIHDNNSPETWAGEGYDPNLLSITCAGMPKSCYPYVTWDNFKEGYSFKGKLQPKNVKGGIVLKPIEFTIKKDIITKNKKT